MKSIIIIIIVAIFLNHIEKTVLALGCDTQYLISGNLSGCSDFSTDDMKEIYIKKMQVCLEKQIELAIADYRDSQNNRYAQGQQKPTSEINSSRAVRLTLTAYISNECNN